MNKFTSLAFTVVFALLGLNACNQASYKTVSVQDLNIARSSALVLDVRTAEEFAQGHVPGAKLLPVQELEARINEVPTGKPIFVICRSGNRSKAASDILVKNGRSEINNVAGGTKAWITAGYPLEQ